MHFFLYNRQAERGDPLTGGSLPIVISSLPIVIIIYLFVLPIRLSRCRACPGPGGLGLDGLAVFI